MLNSKNGLFYLKIITREKLNNNRYGKYSDYRVNP
jgi:hypothetical protein